MERTLFALRNYAFNFHSLREYFQALNICCHVFKLHYAALYIFLESLAPLPSVFPRCPIHFNFMNKFGFRQVFNFLNFGSQWYL